MDWKKLLILVFVVLIVLTMLLILGFFSMPNTGTSSNLSAAVFMAGPISGSQVSINALGDDGTVGALLAGPQQTDENGSVSIEYAPSAGTDYVIVESSGGTYFEGGTGSQPTQEALADSEIMMAVVPASSTDAIITPFTSMAASLAMGAMKKGASARQAANMANTAISQQYRIRNIIETTPVAAFDSEAVSRSGIHQRDYGVLLSGFAQEAHALNQRPINLMQALAKDWSDGAVDGLDGNTPIELDSSTTLPPNAGLDGIQQGIENFMAGPSHATNLAQFSIATDQVCANTGFYIDESTLPVWYNGESYSYPLSAAGGNPPYTWNLKPGSQLPSGFELAEDGTLSGTGNLQPGSAESISPPFTVEVTDSSSPERTCDSNLRLIITEKPPAFAPSSITCEVGSECSVDLKQFVQDGTPPYHFYSVASDGPYPLDMMVWSDGTLRGTPAQPGSYEMGICVVDLTGGGDCSAIEIQVNEKQQPKPPPDDGGNNPPVNTCMPGHYAVSCGGAMRCCLNGWVCCGGSCSPPAFC